MKITTLLIYTFLFGHSFSQEIREEQRELISLFKDSASLEMAIEPRRPNTTQKLDVPVSKVYKNRILSSITIPDYIVEGVICSSKNYCLYQYDSNKIVYKSGYIIDISKNIGALTIKITRSFNENETLLITFEKKTNRIINKIWVGAYRGDDFIMMTNCNELNRFEILTAYITNNESIDNELTMAKVSSAKYKINEKNGIIEKLYETPFDLVPIKILGYGDFEFVSIYHKEGR